jgi:hypothetical protein
VTAGQVHIPIDGVMFSSLWDQIVAQVQIRLLFGNGLLDPQVCDEIMHKLCQLSRKISIEMRNAVTFIVVQSKNTFF